MRGATPILPITRRPSLPPPSLPAVPSARLTARFPQRGELRAYLVPLVYLHGLGPSSLPWPSLSLTSSALPGSPSGANLSTLQDSLYVAGCGFALLSQEVTTLQHNRSPKSTGCLPRGPLAVTTTELPPVSRRQLIRTHQRLARLPAPQYAKPPPRLLPRPETTARLRLPPGKEGRAPAMRPWVESRSPKAALPSLRSPDPTSGCPCTVGSLALNWAAPKLYLYSDNLTSSAIRCIIRLAL